MTDVFSKEKRSEVMSRIRNKDTKIEEIVRKWLFTHGYRYRKNDRRYPGCPDVVLPKYKVVIFVHGCFWHGHEGCRLFTRPKTRAEFWTAKINGNIQRDARNKESLEKMGLRVITIYECELEKNPESRLQKLIEEI